MADTKISALTTDSAPHRTNDFAPTYDASAGATKKVALHNLGMYALRGAFTASAPADSTTYYFGAFVDTALTTSAAFNKIYIPRTGIVTAAYILINCTAGTNENSALYMRLNNTTDTLLSGVLALTGSTNSFSNTTLTTAVTAGDYIEFKLVTAAWATNPTTVRGSVWVRVE